MQPIAVEFEKWKAWIHEIQRDVAMRLVDPRQVFQKFSEVTNANQEHILEHRGEGFCCFIRDCYVSHVAMAIRRQVKVGKDSVSLMRLLSEILECSAQFTYEFYLQQFPIDPAYVDWQAPTFKQFSDDGRTVSAAIVRKDIISLKALTEEVENLADKVIAHLDKNGFSGSVTFGLLNKCVDAFDHLVCKYSKLIIASGYSTLETTILYDWQQIFTVPLDARAHDQQN
jgi:hypothetical protein